MVVEFSNQKICGRLRSRVRITTAHPDSFYGIPVIVGGDGVVIDYRTWVLGAYRVVSVGKRERALFDKWCQHLQVFLEAADSVCRGAWRAVSKSEEGV